MSEPGNKVSYSEKYQFLAGGGEMGTLTRAKDWSLTSVGAIDQWPQSLQTTLSIILRSKFPMFLWWGPELICFYNDAYRPSLGQNGKHPAILGMPAATAWAEIWDIIKPLIDQVMAGGEATWSEDQLVPIYRNGKIEDVYWTFSYSPVVDESGKVAGVLVICTETTDKIIATKSLEEGREQLLSAIEAAELGTWDFNPATNKFGGNHRLKDWFGLPAGTELDLHLALNAIAEKDRQRITDAIQNAFDFSSGGRFDSEYTIIQPHTKKEIIVRGIGRVMFDEDKKATRFTGTLHNVTEQVIAQRKIKESEGNLRVIIKQAPIAIAIFRGPNYMVEVANTRALELWGRTENEVLNKPILEVMSELDSQGIKNLLDTVYYTGIPFSATELPVNLLRDNHLETIYINFAYEPFYNGDGQIDGIITVGADVTPQFLARKTIQESEEKFRLLADTMPQFVWTADAEGTSTYINRSFNIFLGLTAGDLGGEEWINLIHKDDQEKNSIAWRHSISTGSDFVVEHRMRRFDGEYFWYLSRAVAQRNAAGIQMWVGSSTDINLIKEQEQQRDYFISVASHELKTPITSLKGYVQLLKRNYGNADDPFLKNSLKIMDKQVVTLTALITELLDISKIKAGRFYLEKEYFDVIALIKESMDEVRLIYPGYKILYTGEAGVDVNADRDRIGQVLNNLLSNAVKYSPNSSEITVTTRIDGNYVTISIQDSGIGISKNDQERIFERFYRVEGSNEGNFSGFGIGLFIASEIVHGHNGTIGVSSEPGLGSTFYFSLPLNGDRERSV